MNTLRLYLAIGTVAFRATVNGADQTASLAAQTSRFVNVTGAVVHVWQRKEREMREVRLGVYTDHWLPALAATLSHASFEPRPACFCIGNPQIDLYDGHQLVLSIGVHADDVLSLASNHKYRHFYVGKDVVAEVLRLTSQLEQFVPPNPHAEIDARPVQLPPIQLPEFPLIQADKASEPTTTAVTPTAAQEPRQP